MNDLLDSLNNNQKEAVLYNEGPLLIIAGAGTGKTRVITNKIAYLISKKLAKPAEILALTFTEKAASEMEERVDLLVPYGFVDTTISTFHSFGNDIIKDFSMELGLPANYKVLNKTEQAIFLRQHIYNINLKMLRPSSNPTVYIEDLITHFSRLKDELISAKEYLDYAQKQLKIEDNEENQKTLELAIAYSAYQDLMVQSGKLDYGDQIFLSYNLLKNNKKILTELSRKYKYILIDEFQDTNFAQYELIKLISKQNNKITAVGDDDQSIYKFRGASISNIMSFKRDFKNCKQIVLKNNYRSTREILDGAYKLIKQNNPDRLEIKNNIDKELIANKNGSPIEFIFAQDLSSEAEAVALKIKDYIKNKYCQNSDIAILARANNHLGPFISTLNYHGIPNIFIGPVNLFHKPEVMSLVSFLRLLVNGEDGLAFYQLASSELYRADPKALGKFFVEMKNKNRPFDELVSNNKIINKVIKDISRYRENELATKSAGEILYNFLKEKNYIKQLLDEGSVDAEIKIKNIASFFEKIFEFDNNNDNANVLGFLENLDLISTIGDDVENSTLESDIDAVSMLTMHSAKGLEFKVVFIVNAVNDRIPSRRRRDKFPIPQDIIKEDLPEGDFHLQEERRLFYVASTRAMDNLIITGASDYGGKRKKKPSRFVFEILDDPNLIKKSTTLSAVERISRYNTSDHKKEKVKFKSLKKLSRQQIDDYYTCPKKFYFSNVIKIPLPTNPQFMYGTAIHEAVGRYFQRKINKDETNLEQLIEDFKSCFKNEGFITRDHEDQRLEKGIQTLTAFYQEMEKDPITPYSVEDAFEFQVGEIKVRGRYDLIIKNGENYEIYDFKTSELKTQQDANKRVKDSTQMAIYALAFKNSTGITPKTTLIFIESGIKASVIISQKEMEKIKEVITEVYEGINKEIFDPKPNPIQCKYCPYKDICNKSD